MASPAKNKTNFKTYDASTRLLAAVIATTNVKLDYVELARYMGGATTKDAINHRLRPIKQLAKMQAACVAKGEDPGDLPVDKGALAELVGGGTTGAAVEHRMRPIKQLAKLQVAYRDAADKDPGDLPVEKGEIQKLFGESTPSGIEWQFRDIKNLAKAQQQAVNNGQNPAKVTMSSTPSVRRRKGAAGAAAGASTPSSRATATPKTPGTGTSTQGRKRKATATLAPLDSDEDQGNGDNNDSDCTVVDTPSKRPSKTPKTTAASASAKKKSGSTTVPTAAAAAAPEMRTSIFGGDGSVPDIMPSTESFEDGIGSSAAAYDTRLFTSAPEPAVTQTRPAPVKLESAAESNPFLSAANMGDFEDEDEFEEGEC
ncbi:hypothetical protein F5Y14DRAFT_448126 [Nemania sp. NC0429]|nr:hypothetical protein F5Y14DRAFT_448126 [Nemania sp. NC0429]